MSSGDAHWNSIADGNDTRQLRALSAAGRVVAEQHGSKVLHAAGVFGGRAAENLRDLMNIER
jgi:hypothetical protein